METFADRLKAAMNEQGLKQVDLVRLAQQKGIKLGKSHVSQYVSGKTIPRTDILHFLADALLSSSLHTVHHSRCRHPQIIQEV